MRRIPRQRFAVIDGLEICGDIRSDDRRGGTRRRGPPTEAEEQREDERGRPRRRQHVLPDEIDDEFRGRDRRHGSVLRRGVRLAE